MSKGKTSRFNTDWLSREEYKNWLLPEESDNIKARCKICKRTFSLSNMGKTAVKSHVEGKKYASSVKVSQRTESVSDFFKKKDVSTDKCSFEKSGANIKWTSFQQKDRTRIKSADKIGLEERATQS